jgi:hypothetical protein
MSYTYDNKISVKVEELKVVAQSVSTLEWLEGWVCGCASCMANTDTYPPYNDPRPQTVMNSNDFGGMRVFADTMYLKMEQ